MPFTTFTVPGTNGDDTLPTTSISPTANDLWIFWGDSPGTIGGNATLLAGGNDTIHGADGVARNSLYGDADTIAGANSTTFAQGGNDVLYGGSGTGTQAVTDPWNYGNFLFGDAYLISGGTKAGTATDIFRARGGNDTLYGGYDSQYEYLYGDAYQMWGLTNSPLSKNTLAEYNRFVFGGNDVLVGSDQTLYSNVYGDAAVVTDVVQLGDDSLIGGDGNQRQVLCGDAYEMGNSNFQGGNNPIQVIGGDDDLWGGKHASRLSNTSSARDVYLVGDGFTMYTGSQGGTDKLYSAGSWLNPLNPGTISDYKDYITWMIGDAFTAGQDFIPKGDFLFSGPGNDYMYGDNVEGSSKGAADSFVFTSLDYTGEDNIVDFDFSRNTKISTDSLVFAGEFYSNAANDSNSLNGKNMPAFFAWLQGTIKTANIPSSDTYFVFNDIPGAISSLYVYGLPSNVLLGNDWNSFSTKYTTAIILSNYSAYTPIAPGF